VRRLAVVAVLLVLAAATAYETAVAAGWIAMGSEPGGGPRGDSAVRIAVVVALFVGALLCLSGDPRPRPLPALLAPAGVAYVVARFYSYDPYYLPTLRRMSDLGEVAPPVIYALVAVTAAVFVLSLVRPRIGLRAAAALLLVSMAVSALEGAGH
jgi:hypothetical protein